MKGTVLLTGGEGFIGSHTADALAQKGYKIRIFGSLSRNIHDGSWPNYLRKKNFDLIRGDVRKKKDWEKVLPGVDYVFHLAAHQDQLPNYSKFFEVNTLSTSLLYQIIEEKNLPIKKIVYASSQYVYGDGEYTDQDGKFFQPELRTQEQLKRKEWEILDNSGEPANFYPFRESQNPNPTNSYGLSKIASENFILRVGKTLGIPSTIARYSIVQGARQSPRNLYSGALRIFVTQALNGDPITVHEDGNQLRDFVNIEDVVDANILLLEDDRTNFEIYNVGGGKGYTVYDFADMVKRITKSDSEIVITGSYRKTDTRHAVSSIEKIGKLGWYPKFDPKKSIKEYVSWIKEEGFNIKELREGVEEKARSIGVVGQA